MRLTHHPHAGEVEHAVDDAGPAVVLDGGRAARARQGRPVTLVGAQCGERRGQGDRVPGRDEHTPSASGQRLRQLADGAGDDGHAGGEVLVDLQR